MFEEEEDPRPKFKTLPIPKRSDEYIEMKEISRKITAYNRDVKHLAPQFYETWIKEEPSISKEGMLKLAKRAFDAAKAYYEVCEEFDPKGEE